jgi:hypothetical protein
MNLLRTHLKKAVRVSAAVVVASALSVGSAFGFGAIYTIDNNGSAYWNLTQMAPYTITTEPMSGMTALQYTLPFVASAGDVLLETSGGGPATDMLRFDGTDHVYFFSTTGTGTLGYVSSLPTPISPTQGPLLLQNSAGVWSVSYTPTSGQPGYDAQAAGSIYSILVYVPEPDLVGLLAVGAGLTILFRTRRLAGHH